MSSEKKGFKIVILAAGKGTRMKSSRAKVLHDVAGRPMLAYVLDTAESAGADEIVVVVGYQGDAVRTAFQERNVRFVWQREQLGTAHAVMSAREAVAGYKGNIVILCGDVPLLRPETLRGLVDRCKAEDASVAVLTAVVDDPEHYGRIIKDESGNVLRIVEEMDATAEERAIREVNTGIYCVKCEVLTAALERVRRDNAQREYYLTDIVELAREAGERAIGVVAGSAEEVIGINSREDLAEASRMKRTEINRKWMMDGVSIIDPSSTYIEPSVDIGRDSIIYPFTVLRGQTRIGEGVTIFSFCHIEDAKIPAGKLIGPFAHLRKDVSQKNRQEV
ncbi:MAG: NTP transferase domain-containing protein [Pseudomonadota bacterium]